MWGTCGDAWKKELIQHEDKYKSFKEMAPEAWTVNWGPRNVVAGDLLRAAPLPRPRRIASHI